MRGAKPLARRSIKRQDLARQCFRANETEEGRTLQVLFVCTGNICRSPTAERLAAAYAAAHQVPDFTVSSAGTRAVIGHPMHPDAARVLGNLGGDSAGFRARQLTPRIAASVDLVLTMTRAHRDAVLELAPRLLRRTFTLNEAARLVSKFGVRDVMELSALRPQLGHEYEADILDPIGQDLDVFSRVGSMIAEALSPVMELCRHSVTTP